MKQRADDRFDGMDTLPPTIGKSLGTSGVTLRPHLVEHDGKVIPLTEEVSLDSWRQRLCQSIGVSDLPLVAHVLEQTLGASMSSPGIDGVAADAILAVLCESDPPSTQVLLLKAQMAACHHHVMNLMGKAVRTASDAAAHDSLKLAAKLMSAYAGHLALLEKLKKGGNQTMTVRHVHVHDGGQAIVGCIGGGGGR